MSNLPGELCLRRVQRLNLPVCPIASWVAGNTAQSPSHGHLHMFMENQLGQLGLLLQFPNLSHISVPDFIYWYFEEILAVSRYWEGFLGRGFQTAVSHSHHWKWKQGCCFFSLSLSFFFSSNFEEASITSYLRPLVVSLTFRLTRISPEQLPSSTCSAPRSSPRQLSLPSIAFFRAAPRRLWPSVPICGSGDSLSLHLEHTGPWYLPDYPCSPLRTGSNMTFESLP